MKIIEVLKVPLQTSHGLNLSYWDKVVQFKGAKVEKYPLMAHVEGDDYFFCVVDPDTHDKLAYLKAVKVDEFKKPSLVIQRTWVEKKFRNQGIATALYNTLYNQGFSIISDVELSPESLAIWKKLKMTYANKIKVLNAQSKDVRLVSDDDLSDPSGDTDERFFLEGKVPHFKLKIQDNFMLEEYNLFIGGDSP